MKIETWNETYAREVEAWHYEPPYDFYGLASDPDDLASNRVPTRYERLRAVLGEGGRLDAFWYVCRHGVTLYERLGFREVAREMRRFELVGDHEFVRMERAA